MNKPIIAIVCAAMSLPAMANYDINYPADATIEHATRCLNSLSLSVDGLHGQTLQVGQTAGGKLYFDLTDKCLVAVPGEAATITFGWTGTWMNGYVYVDQDDNGAFDAADLLAYSHHNGKDSNGASNNGNALNPPAFTVPNAPGLHRMRLKVDWDNIDPAGNNSDNNNILKNGGAIVDVMLLVADGNHGGINITATNGNVTVGEAAGGYVPFTLTPNQGYAFDGMTVSAGFTCPDASVAIVEPSLQHSEALYTSAFAADGVINVPVGQLAGGAEVEAFFIAETAASQGRYSSVYSGGKDVGQGFTQLSVNGKSKAISTTDLHSFSEDAFSVMRGGELTVNAKFTGDAVKYNLYVDVNQDGEFNANAAALSCELLACGTELPLVATLPELPAAAVLRARLEAEGHSDVEFLLNVYNAQPTLRVNQLNCLVTNSDDSPLPLTLAPLTAQTLKVCPVLAGFELETAVIRHGQNLNGPEYVMGNRQWVDTPLKVLSSGKVNIAASNFDGDAELYIIYKESADSEWAKVWGDEFNDGKLDTKRWAYHPRYSATWNRLVANTTKEQRMVNTFDDGYYNSLCIPTPEEFTDETQPMISGAIYSQGKFTFRYGKIEARIKTTPHTGNFPAFWLMPAYSELSDLGLNGWPRDGEIDIWEQIDDQNRSHHTVHSGWTGWRNYCGWSDAPKVGSPASTSNRWGDATLWHVYSLEWEPEQLRWYVDGQLAFSYTNQHYSEEGSEHYIEKVTWPFDKHFYVILNQSVGNGSWAANCDTDFSYATLFDYVRVYQKKGDADYDNTSSLKNNGDDPDFYVPAKGYDESSIIEVGFDQEFDGPAEYFDLHGRRTAASAPGIYLLRQGSKTTKIIL